MPVPATGGTYNVAGDFTAVGNTIYFVGGTASTDRRTDQHAALGDQRRNRCPGDAEYFLGLRSRRTSPRSTDSTLCSRPTTAAAMAKSCGRAMERPRERRWSRT